VASISQVIEGLKIIHKYGNDLICAEHDIIYAGGDVIVDEEDSKKLESLGWHWDQKTDSWARFV
jgi:hypothetical protein